MVPLWGLRHGLPTRARQPPCPDPPLPRLRRWFLPTQWRRRRWLPTQRTRHSIRAEQAIAITAWTLLHILWRGHRYIINLAHALRALSAHQAYVWLQSYSPQTDQRPFAHALHVISVQLLRHGGGVPSSGDAALRLLLLYRRSSSSARSSRREAAWASIRADWPKAQKREQQASSREQRRAAVSCALGFAKHYVDIVNPGQGQTLAHGCADPINPGCMEAEFDD